MKSVHAIMREWTSKSIIVMLRMDARALPAFAVCDVPAMQIGQIPSRYGFTRTPD